METIIHCLNMGGNHAETSHVRTMRDCADICDACAESCETFDDRAMRTCAQRCRECSSVCREMAGGG